MTSRNNERERALVTAVARWFRRSARPLPWRNSETTPWGVLLSEIMAQQTPVGRVAPIWTEWISRWPTPTSLANASPADVVRAWGRLGYPRRALNLHAAATRIREEFGGDVPSDVATLESLPGIGAYTARAVAAFAFGRRVPVVDTNIRRVLFRAVLGIAEPAPPRVTADMGLMESVLPIVTKESVAVNAGLMELGATFCVARNPDCAGCPVAEHCAWALAGFPDNAGATRTPQKKYEGSVRQARGAILALARADHRVTAAAIATAVPDQPRRDLALEGLLSDGLLVDTPKGFELPR
ncbi:MAG: A/G-specific adenine glycosylase [Microbacteriaceae bacterium]